MNDKSLALEPGLYVTATPIGNLGDMTFRAVETMKAADVILCEDTRQTGKLCAAYGISTPRQPYHEHNAERARPEILEKLRAGGRICLVSDAGTPLIADPGYKLVADARSEGLNVFPVPGACAAIAGLSVSGAATDRFTFAGFAPSKSGARHKFFENIIGLTGTVIFYESANRLGASLTDLADLAGPDRTVNIARELTKIHETFYVGRVDELARAICENPVKGEVVVILHPAAVTETSDRELTEFLSEALENMSVREAAATAAETLKVPRKRAYDAALGLKKPQ